MKDGDCGTVFSWHPSRLPSTIVYCCWTQISLKEEKSNRIIWVFTCIRLRDNNTLYTCKGWCKYRLISCLTIFSDVNNWILVSPLCVQQHILYSSWVHIEPSCGSLHILTMWHFTCLSPHREDSGYQYIRSNLMFKYMMPLNLNNLSMH